MKTVIVLDGEDLRKIVSKSFGVDPSKIEFNIDGDYSCNWGEVEIDKAIELIE